MLGKHFTKQDTTLVPICGFKVHDLLSLLWYVNNGQWPAHSTSFHNTLHQTCETTLTRTYQLLFLEIVL